MSANRLLIVACLALPWVAGAAGLEWPPVPAPAECENLAAFQQQDLRLAARAQQGEAAFVRYVHFKRPMMQWSTDEAIHRARMAAISPCGVAIGLKPIDSALFPNLLVGAPELPVPSGALVAERASAAP
jgi:hypothetical protein